MRIVSKEFSHPMPKVRAIMTGGKQAKIWDVNNLRREETSYSTSLGDQDWPPRRSLERPT